MLILVTGRDRKVGRRFIARLLADTARRMRMCVPSATIALLAETERVEVVRGSIADRDVVERAMAGRHPCRPSRDLQGDSRTTSWT